MNLAPYENYVLTNDIIEGGARSRERAGEICTRAARRARVFIKLAEKREMRKNESGEYAGNRSGECAVARESKRNDWTDKHMEGWRGNG